MQNQLDGIHLADGAKLARLDMPLERKKISCAERNRASNWQEVGHRELGTTSLFLFYKTMARTGVLGRALLRKYGDSGANVMTQGLGIGIYQRNAKRRMTA